MAAGAADQAKEGAQGMEPSAPNINLEPPVYEGNSRQRRAHLVDDGAARLGCTGELVPVLFEINGPKDMGMHIVAPMGLRAVENAVLRLDDTGALRIVLTLAALDQSDVIVSRHLNG